MNRLEMNENMIEQINGASYYWGRNDSLRKKAIKEKEIREIEEAGFDYYEKDGVTIFTKKF